MGKPQLFNKKSSISLNEMGKDTCYFFVLHLEDKFFIGDAKIYEEFFGLRALFLDLKTWAFSKITMPKSINSL